VGLSLKVLCNFILFCILIGCATKSSNTNDVFIQNIRSIDPSGDTSETTMLQVPYGNYLTSNLSSNSVQRWYQIDSIFNIGEINQQDSQYTLCVFNESKTGITRNSFIDLRHDYGEVKYDNDIILQIDTHFESEEITESKNTNDRQEVVFIDYYSLNRDYIVSIELTLNRDKKVKELNCRMKKADWVIPICTITYAKAQESHRIADLFPLAERKKFFQWVLL